MELPQSDFELLQNLVEIRPTPYQWGVFARTAFCEGDVVGLVEGPVVYGADYCSAYCMELNDECSVEPVAPFRYLNHSCEPNCQIAGDDFPVGKNKFVERLFIEVIRDISAGDQLTIDYAWPADMAVRCMCLSPQCRGWIVDMAEQHLIRVPA